MKKITFHLKSGTAIVAYAKDIEIERINGNNLFSYKLIKPSRNPHTFYLRIEDISAIQIKRSWRLF